MRGNARDISFLEIGLSTGAELAVGRSLHGIDIHSSGPGVGRSDLERFEIRTEQNKRWEACNLYIFSIFRLKTERIFPPS